MFVEQLLRGGRFCWSGSGVSEFSFVASNPFKGGTWGISPRFAASCCISRGVPCVRDKAVQGERPKGRIALDQLRQRPLGVQRRQPNSFVDFAALADAVEGARPKGRLSSPAVW